MKKIGWKMGRKDVPKNTGSGRSAKPGVPTVFQCIERNQNTRYSEDMLFYRTSMRRNNIPFLYMEEENAKAGTRSIWSYSAVFWNARLFMTGIQPVFREGIIIVKQIQTLRLCT